MSRSDVISIIVTYADGSTEEFPKSLANKLRQNQGDHKTLAGFVLELFHLWDKDYALAKQARQHDKELMELEEEHEDELEAQAERAKRQHEVGLEQQSAILRGQNLEKWLPCLSEYPYDNGDVIKVFDTFDYLVLVGRVQQSFSELVFQEVKTGNESHILKHDQNNLRLFIESIKDDRVRFEHWARRVKDDKFSLVKHRS